MCDTLQYSNECTCFEYFIHFGIFGDLHVGLSAICMFNNNFSTESSGAHPPPRRFYDTIANLLLFRDRMFDKISEMRTVLPVPHEAQSIAFALDCKPDSFIRCALFWDQIWKILLDKSILIYSNYRCQSQLLTNHDRIICCLWIGTAQAFLIVPLFC